MRSPFLSLLLLTLLPLGAALAQPAHPVEQVVRGLSPERADRMLTALSLKGGALYPFLERTGSSTEDVRIGIRWTPPDHPVREEGGWSLRGRLRLAILKNPDWLTRIGLWSTFRLGIDRPLGLELPRSADMKFIYDKVVHVRYHAERRELRVTLEDAPEEHGSFNLTVTQTLEANFAGGASGSFGVNARSLSVDVQASSTQVTVVVAGLPYVVRPVLEVRSVDGGDYLTLAWGLVWESRVALTARTFGVREESGQTGEVSLGWGSTEGEVKLKGSGYSRNSEYESSVTLESTGDGLRAVLVYDERVANRAYELAARANQQWQLHVDASPIVRVGSIQEERQTPIGERSYPWLPSWAPGVAGADELYILRPEGLQSEALRRDQVLERFEQEPTRGGESPAPPPPPAITPEGLEGPTPDVTLPAPDVTGVVEVLEGR